MPYIYSLLLLPLNILSASKIKSGPSQAFMLRNKFFDNRKPLNYPLLPEWDY